MICPETLPPHRQPPQVSTDSWIRSWSLSSCTRRKFSRRAESCAAPAEVDLEIRDADAMDIAEHQTQLSHAEDLA